MLLNVKLTQYLIEQLTPKVYLEIGIGPARNHLSEISELFFSCGGEQLHACDPDPRAPDPEVPLGQTYYRHNCTSRELAARWTHGEIDMLLIDGDHTFQGSYQDFRDFGPHLKEHTGVMMLHDTYPANPKEAAPRRSSHKVWCGEAWKTAEAIRKKHHQEYEVMTLPVRHGLTLVRRTRRQLSW